MYRLNRNRIVLFEKHTAVIFRSNWVVSSRIKIEEVEYNMKLSKNYYFIKFIPGNMFGNYPSPPGECVSGLLKSGCHERFIKQN